MGHSTRDSDSISAFQCDVVREAFRKLVVEAKIPEDRWRDIAEQMIRDVTGELSVDPDLLERIMRK